MIMISNSDDGGAVNDKMPVPCEHAELIRTAEVVKEKQSSRNNLGNFHDGYLGC